MPDSAPVQLADKPDYGTLGPSSDFGSNRPVVPSSNMRRPIVAILLGIAVAVPFLLAGRVRAAWDEVSTYLSVHGKPVAASPSILSRHETESLDQTSAQQQASLLL